MQIILYCMMILSCFFTACAKKESPVGGQIKKILFKGRYYNDKKEFDKALMEYQSLKQYKDSKAYEELQPAKEMEKAGWSADKLKCSYTIKVMTELQNNINKYIKENGHFPNMMIPPYDIYDAWGKKIKLNTDVAKKHAKFFDYSLFSPGEDLKTDIDDIAIYNKSLNTFTKDNKEIKKTKQTKNDSEQMMDLEKMIKLTKKDEK